MVKMVILNLELAVHTQEEILIFGKFFQMGNFAWKVNNKLGKAVNIAGIFVQRDNQLPENIQFIFLREIQIPKECHFIDSDKFQKFPKIRHLAINWVLLKQELAQKFWIWQIVLCGFVQKIEKSA